MGNPTYDGKRVTNQAIEVGDTIANIIKREEVFDGDTGELLHSKQRKLKMFIFSEKGYAYQHNRRSIKMYPTLPLPDLSHSELGQLFLVARYMENGNLIPLTSAEIAALLGFSVNHTYLFINRMIEADVMKRKGRSLYINPLYWFAGKYMSNDLYQLFKESLDKVLKNWTKKQLNGE
jgi:hypothetical protein